MNPERIIFIAEDLSFPIDEGMKKYNYFLLQYLKTHFSDFVLFTLEDNDLTNESEIINNKSFVSLKLFLKIRKFNPRLVIYSPSSSGTLLSFVRLFIIKLASLKSETIIINLQRRHHSQAAKAIIKFIKPRFVVVFSKKDSDYYNSMKIDTLPGKTGVDLNRFLPVNKTRKEELRRKYGFNELDKILLHIGHIKESRNISVLKPLLAEGYQVLLVGSTSTSQDMSLKYDLEKSGIKILDSYISQIEEIYQLSDIYVFPVINDNSAIEFPLSVLEAMACNLPVVTTPYGSLPDYFDQSGCFTYFSNKEELHRQVGSALRSVSENREVVLMKFSWEGIFDELFHSINKS
jgi:glycosyltransferase involved in cell wall biosynthesis